MLLLPISEPVRWKKAGLNKRDGCTGCKPVLFNTFPSISLDLIEIGYVIMVVRLIFSCYELMVEAHFCLKACIGEVDKYVDLWQIKGWIKPLEDVLYMLRPNKHWIKCEMFSHQWEWVNTDDNLMIIARRVVECNSFLLKRIACGGVKSSKTKLALLVGSN